MWAGSGDIEAGVIAHGSLIKEPDVEAIQKPVLFLYSDNDQQIPDELREKFQAILKTKSFPTEGIFYKGQV
jgi:dienelactone hydrolase